MKPAAVALLLLAAAAPAFAQNQPTLPLRDVMVTYRLGGSARDMLPGGLPEVVRAVWGAREQRLRVEPQGRAQYLLLDLPRSSVRLVDGGLHSALALPVRPGDLDPIRLADARLTRGAPAVVAGLPCTDFTVQSRHGNGTVCLTPDGLALRATGEVNGRSGSLQALSVSWGPVPPGAFDVPAGFMSLALPSGLGRLP